MQNFVERFYLLFVLLDNIIIILNKLFQKHFYLKKFTQKFAIAKVVDSYTNPINCILTYT